MSATDRRSSRRLWRTDRLVRPAFSLACLAAACGVLGTGAAAAPAGAVETRPAKLAPLELPVPDSVLTRTDRRWMSAYFHGFKAGWAVHSLGPATIEGRDCICSSFEMTTEFKALSVVQHRFTSVRKWYDKAAPHRAFLIEQTEKLGDQVRRVVIRNEDGGTRYSMDITEAGDAKSRQLIQLDLRLAQETSPRLWAADPARRPGDAFTTASLHPPWILKGSEQTATILREARWTGPAGPVPVWEIDTFDHTTQARSLMRVSRRDGKPVTIALDANLELRIDTEEAAKQMPGLAPDVYVLAGITASRRLGDATRLSEVVLELTAPDGKQVPELAETVHQTVERKKDGSVIVRMSRNGGKPQLATATDRDEALRSTPRYPLEDTTVRQLAARAIRGAGDDRSAVRNLLRFTRSYIKEALNAKSLTVMDVIQSKKGDCTAHALLFTTLARAAGIPARETRGWMYSGDRNQAFGGHAWSEVILDGQWVPVDAVWAEMNLGPVYIQANSPSSQNPKPSELVTGLTARILSIKTIP